MESGVRLSAVGVRLCGFLWGTHKPCWPKADSRKQIASRSLRPSLDGCTQPGLCEIVSVMAVPPGLGLQHATFGIARWEHTPVRLRFRDLQSGAMWRMLVPEMNLKSPC